MRSSASTVSGPTTPVPPPPPPPPRTGDPARMSDSAPLGAATWVKLAAAAVGAMLASAALGWGSIQFYGTYLAGGTSGWDGGLLEVAFALFLGAGVALVSYIGLCTCTVWSVVRDPERRAGPLLAMIVGPLALALAVVQVVPLGMG